MIELADTHLLYIEPKEQPTEPVMDELTEKMEKEFAIAQEPPPREFWRGVHYCICGERSTNRDYMLQGGLKVNSLCVHYIRDHRSEVPESELDKLRNL